MDFCSVLLVQPSSRGEKPLLPRPLVQVLEQRAAVVAGFSARDDAWCGWGDQARSRLIVHAAMLGPLTSGVLVPVAPIWSLQFDVAATDFDGMAPGPQATLRLVQTLEEAMVSCARLTATPPPAFLGRTKRELEWLAGGGVEPGPARTGAIRVRADAGPMPLKRFWAVIDQTTGEGSGAFRLPPEHAERFVARLGLLVAELDTPAHLDAARRALGFTSDDVWEDVRTWMVSQGEGRYRAAVADPATLESALRGIAHQDDLGVGERLLYLTSQR